MSTRLLLSAFVSSIPLVACTASDPSPAPTEDAGDIVDGSRSLPAPAPAAYLQVTAGQPCSDATGCDGFWVSAANRDHLQCADGEEAARCRVDGIDWQAAGLSQETLASLNAALRTGDDRVLVLGTLGAVGSRPMVLATGGWVAIGTSAADSELVLVRDTGVRCVTSPCLSLVEIALNTGVETMIADVDFEGTGASDAQIAVAEQALAGQGVIVAGTRTEVSGPAGTAPGLDATRVWLPAEVDTCYVGGCSGQICSDTPGAVSTCEWRPEYACYQTATCARQGDGACGWTPTPTLEACLASPQP